MTKTQKIESLSTAMTVSKRGVGTSAEGEAFNHFAEGAPEELKDIFMEHYNIKDLDYEIFNRACDVVSGVYADKPDSTDDEATESIYEWANDSASIYTSDRLAYLDNQNEDDISATMREYGQESIATACAIWYDKQVEEAAILIKDWINQ